MVFETFSERKRKSERQGQPDVYVYDHAPPQLRHQMSMALSEGIGYFYIPAPYAMDSVNSANDLWRLVDRICRKEIYPYLKFVDEFDEDLRRRFCDFLMQVEGVDDFLSGVEIGCVALKTVISQDKGARGADQDARDAIEEVNKRFEQHAIGYQFENNQLIRVDSKFTHDRIVKPALVILLLPIFAKANDEFLTAHKHYREGAYKDSVTAANRAFECILKAICDVEKWSYDKGDRAAELVSKVTNNGLFTRAFDKSFSAYTAMLRAGLPTVRNDAGGHGEGIVAAAVTGEVARFALNLTASNILFLGDSYKAFKDGIARGSLTRGP